MRSLMSFAACDERCARLRTSDATTAKPRPASPARAASTAALSASRLVCRAISSITLMMSEILREDSSIRAIALTALATTWPPRSATSRVPLADWLACWAFSAFFFTVTEMCSIEAVVSARLAPCSSVRCERSVVLVEISAAALATSRVEAAIEPMVSLICAIAVLKSSLILVEGLAEAVGQAEREIAARELAEPDAEGAEGLGLLFRELGALLRSFGLQCGLGLLAAGGLGGLMAGL